MANVNRDQAPVRAFDNPLLEKLSRVHPIVPLLCWGPVVLAAITFGLWLGLGPGASGLLFFAGIGVWTLAEYALHRWAFHWQPRAAHLRKAVYAVHQLHHDVQERDRLVAPLLMSVPIALGFFGLFWLLFRIPTMLPLFGGFVAGYLVYDYIHFFTHFGTPRTRFGKGLRRRHLQHHFACPDRWYGVSSPLWDFVFRTHVPRGRKPAQI